MDNSAKVIHVDEYLTAKTEKAVQDFNKILDESYATMSEEDFEKFGNEMLVEVERLTKYAKESNNEHT